MADALDNETEANEAIVNALKNAGVESVSVNGGEPVPVPAGGFRKNNFGNVDLPDHGECIDPALLEQNALSERMFKLRKKIHPDLIEEMEAMDEESLRHRISQCETNLLESEKAREADEELATLKEKVKEMTASYNEVKKAQRAIAEYAACLLDQKGVA
jgi:hypothetical protein